jgi:hypothetical protein
MKKHWLFVFLLFMTVATVRTNERYLFYNQYIQTYPSYEPGMPLEVLFGYIALDSVTHYATHHEISEFIQRQTFNDTLQYLMKHYFHVVDYNPMLYKSTYYYSDTTLISRLMIIEGILRDKILKTSPNGYLDYSICGNEFIAHLIITDTTHIIDTNDPGSSGHVINVDAEIVELFKGQVIPGCHSMWPLKTSPGKLLSQQADSGSCFQFSYTPRDSRRGKHGGIFPLKLPDGGDWIRPGMEYIVFLNFASFRSDSTHYYFCPIPATGKSGVKDMFPVMNDTIYDPADDFGWGEGKTLHEFKGLLRERINEIRNYGE